MKTITLFTLLLLLTIIGRAESQTFEIRAVNKGGGVIGVEMRATSSLLVPSTSTLIVDLVCGLKWSSTYGVNLLAVDNTAGYQIIKSGGRVTQGAWHFQSFAQNTTPWTVPSSWTQGVWTEIFSVTNDLAGTGQGDFHICEKNFHVTTDPVISFDGVNWYEPTINGFANNVPLPVELITFSARPYQSHVHLHWETATELNNYGFEVQRKEPGHDWDVIGFVAGKGTVLYPQVYDYFDYLQDLRVPIRKEAVLSYRLRQIDRDGSYDYSPVVNIGNAAKPRGVHMEIYPNPTSQRSHIALSTEDDAHVTVTIHSLLGKEIVRLVDDFLPKGQYLYELQTRDLPRGQYFIRMRQGNVTESMVLTVVK
jgi:hypothetical protein